MSEETIVAPAAAPALVPSQAPLAATEASPPQDGAHDNEPEQSGESDEQKVAKPRKPASERISELYGRMKSAEEARDLALAEVRRLRTPVVAPEQWDSLSYDQQQAAQMRHAVRQERAEELASEAHFRQQEAQASRGAMFQDRLAAVKETIPDIDVVVNDPSLPVSEIGARFITESDKGPQVAYWLAQNRAEAARIARLDPLAQAFELGRIETRISAAPSSRKVSSAPAPVPRVGGGANTGAKDPARMSMSEYVEWRNKRG